MSTVTVPASTAQALGMLGCAMGFLADAEAAQMPSGALAAFDAKDGHLADGQRTSRAWLVHCLRVTRAQAAGHLAVAGLAREHPRLLAGLRDGHAITRSVALQLARWMRAIPAEFRDQAEEIVVTAAQAGADLRALAAIAAEIRHRTAPPDPDGQDDGHLDRGLSLDTTLDGAGVLHGDLTPECAAMVRAVLDALSAPQGSQDARTRPERYHDALAEAMKRLLAASLVPRAGRRTGSAAVELRPHRRERPWETSGTARRPGESRAAS